jgi:hypothetical protein
MPEKKITRQQTPATVTMNLDADEDLVEEVTTRKTIGRKKREQPPPAPEPEPEVIEAELVDDDENDDQEISDNSLASVIFGEANGRDLDNQFCTVHVRRNPDGMGDHFATPCSDVLNLPRIPNLPLTTDKADIEERVQRDFGGGRYFFQLYYNGQLGRSWQAVLADLPNAAYRAITEQHDPPPVAQHTAPVVAPPLDPLDNFLKQAGKMKELRDVLFGDDLKELERLRNAASQQPPEHKSERLQMLDTALQLPAPLQEKALGYLFPADSDGSKGTVAQIGEFVLENHDKILPVINGLLGSLFGGGVATAPQPNTGMAPPAQHVAMPGLSPTEPPAAAPLQTSRFKRPEPVSETPVENEADAIDAEPAETIEPHPATTEPAVKE